MLFCLGLWQSSQAIDRLDGYPHGVGLLPAAAVDATTLQKSPHRGPARGLCLDAELLDRDGRRWSLQWKLLGDEAVRPGESANRAWRAGVVMSSPDGRLHERVFARGTGLVGRLASSADDWEWRPQGAMLLPAKLRFDVDGREVILLLEAMESPGAGNQQGASRVRVRGFVNLGIEKTYLSGRGQLQRDWHRLARRAPPRSGRSPATTPMGDKL